jgi:hypothetical protein
VKNLMKLLAVFMFLIGCQKETELKTSQNVKIHEIVVTQDSSIVYWYVFFKDGKFIYTNSSYQMSDFSSTFFLSSKEIPEELKFSEEFIRNTAIDSVDNWGVEVVELQEDDSISVDILDTTQNVDTTVVDSLELDTLKLDTTFKNQDSLCLH